MNSCIGQVGPASNAHPDASASVTALLTSGLSNLSSTSHSLVHGKQAPLVLPALGVFQWNPMLPTSALLLCLRSGKGQRTLRL